MTKPPALVRRYVLVASLPDWCEPCNREKQTWIRPIGGDHWTFIPCPHCTDAAPLHELLEEKTE